MSKDNSKDLSPAERTQHTKTDFRNSTANGQPPKAVITPVVSGSRQSKSLQHIVYESIRALPLMLNDAQACWVLGIGRATFHRRVKSGEIKPPTKSGSNTSRWSKAYIISKMGDDELPAVVDIQRR